MGRRTTAVIAACLMALSLAACGDDGDNGADNAGSGSENAGQSGGDNTLQIVESEYAFNITGEAVAGSLAIDVENAGAELHEIGMAKLLDGKTMDDVRAALDAATEETENVLEGVAEEDTAIDELAGGQAPGTSYTITGPDAEAGEYAVLCFIPNAEGVPHFKLGMVGSFTVAEGSDDESPEPGVTYTATNEELDGPTEVEAGETAIAVVNDTDIPREILLLKLAEGKTVEDAGAFFESADQGPPDFANSPFEFFTFVFDAEADRTLTVDLTPGQWAIETPDPENQFEGPPTENPHAILFTVS